MLARHLRDRHIENSGNSAWDKSDLLLSSWARRKFLSGSFPRATCLKGTTVTCPTPSPKPNKSSDPISSFTAMEICILRMKLGKRPRQLDPFCLCHLGCCALTTCDAKRKEKDLRAEHGPNLCLQSYIEKGEARGRLEEKKKQESSHVQTDWMNTNSEWRRLFPAQQNSTAKVHLKHSHCTWPQSLDLELWLWIISLQNSSLKMQHVSPFQLLLKPLSKEKDLSEFQPFGTEIPLWKMKKTQNGSFYPARYLPALKTLELHYESPWGKSSTVRVSKHCTLSLKTQTSGYSFHLCFT